MGYVKAGFAILYFMHYITYYHITDATSLIPKAKPGFEIIY